MEIERSRSLSSTDRLRERRRKRKTKWGTLPLALHLSFNDKGVHPRCPNASNPYHKCYRECLEKIPTGNKPDGSERKREMMAEKRVVNPNCPNLSNRYHKCDEYCFREDTVKKPTEKEKSIRDVTDKSDMRPNCKYASNPYHECSKTCFKDTPRKEHSRNSKLSNTLACPTFTEDRIQYDFERGVNHECIDASIPFHACPEKEQSEQATEQTKVEEKVENDIKRRGQRPQRNITEGGMNHKSSREEEKVVSGIDRTSKQLQRKYASSSYQERIEVLPKIMPNRKTTEGAMMAEEEIREVAATVKVHSDYCFQNFPNKTWVGGDGGVNPECKYASNPYHVCAEYCFQDVPNKDRPRQTIFKSKGKKVVAPQEMGVNPECKYASNPYHVCAEYCIDNATKLDQTRKASMKLKEKKKVAVPLENGVNPECKYASNPYHVCEEYCSQTYPGREKDGEVMKPKAQHKMKKVLSNIETSRVHSPCKYATNPYHECAQYCLKNVPNRLMTEGVAVKKPKEGKKEISSAQKRNANPKYTYHKSPEPLPENTQAVEGITAALPKEMKRRNPPKEESEESMQNQNVEHMEALNRIKYIIDFKSDDENEEETKNIVDDTDMKVVHVDAADLFQEWTKYCSQHIIAEKNGEDTLELEKVRHIGGLPRFLPTFALFFLGFLFALLHWEEVIHT